MKDDYIRYIEDKIDIYIENNIKLNRRLNNETIQAKKAKIQKKNIAA